MSGSSGVAPDLFGRHRHRPQSTHRASGRPFSSEADIWPVPGGAGRYRSAVSDSPYALAPDLQAALTGLGIVRRHRRGAFLILEGDRSDHVLFIRSGRLRIVRTSTDGRDVLVAVRGPGELVGELSALAGADETGGVSRRSRRRRRPGDPVGRLPPLSRPEPGRQLRLAAPARCQAPGSDVSSCRCRRLRRAPSRCQGAGGRGRSPRTRRRGRDGRRCRPQPGRPRRARRRAAEVCRPLARRAPLSGSRLDQPALDRDQRPSMVYVSSAGESDDPGVTWPTARSGSVGEAVEQAAGEVAASWSSPRATTRTLGELGRADVHEAAGAGGGAVTVSTVGRAAAASEGGMVGVTAVTQTPRMRTVRRPDQYLEPTPPFHSLVGPSNDGWRRSRVARKPSAASGPPKAIS